ncbi:MAG: response regulator [Clostridiales bacterium]|jgi:putative two-component system response regulator|nr:response regulator [Clostridiales bacterium]
MKRSIILAVDDSLVILKTLSSVLSDTYKVFTLPKPAELKNVLRKLTPELFLLDYKMPELTGFELIPIIRSFEEHKETPIIFLTSVDTLDNVTAAFALGACDFIVKPFDPEILHEKIAKHIAREKAF